MKLAVVSNINGNFKIESEWDVPDLPSADKAIVNFHNKCATLWNASDVEKATVKILDDSLNVFEGYEETIIHTTPEPEE